MVEDTATVGTTYVRESRRISWGGIIAGTIVALMTYLTLNLLGMAIGASTIDVAQGETPSGTAFGIGTALWWTIAGLIALFAGGWVAGRFAAVPRTLDRALHGLVVWGALNLVIFYLLTSAIGQLMGGAASVLGRGLSAAGQAAGGMDLSGLVQGIAGNEAQRGAVLNALRQYATGQRTPEARSALVEALTATGMTQEEANQRIASWEQQLGPGGGVAQAADRAAGATTAASLWLFVSMLLGAGAAAWGGSVAKGPEYVDARRMEVGSEAYRAA